VTLLVQLLSTVACSTDWIALITTVLQKGRFVLLLVITGGKCHGHLDGYRNADGLKLPAEA
jgi:hypothetical protein